MASHISFQHLTSSINNIIFICNGLVTKSCLTPYDSMDYSTPGFSVLRCLSEFAQTHVHWFQWCHPTISSSAVTFLPSVFPSIKVFPMSRLFPLGDQSIRGSTSASVLPMNIQGWFPLGLTALILLAKGFSRVFCSTTIQQHQFFSTQPSIFKFFIINF